MGPRQDLRMLLQVIEKIQAFSDFVLLIILDFESRPEEARTTLTVFWKTRILRRPGLVCKNNCFYTLFTGTHLIDGAAQASLLAARRPNIDFPSWLR